MSKSTSRPQTSEPIHVFFDARFTRTTHHDGISRYGSCLLEALLSAVQGTDIEVTAIISDERQLNLLPDCRWVKLNSPTSPQEIFIARKLNALGADVVFSTMQVMGSTGRRYGLILTVHDLIYYSHPLPPADLPAAVRLLWRAYHLSFAPQRVLLGRADAIAAVSETTKGLIADHHLSSKPVTVVSNAAEVAVARARSVNRHDARSLVYMGSFLPYKNVETLIRSLQQLPGWTLHVASRIDGRREAALRALIPDRAKVIFHRGVSDEEYATLLEGATALVTASQEEGFGLPVIEAMAQGVPVAISDIPIFHEIAGDAAVYFDPDDAGDVAAAIERLSDAALWSEISAAGQKHAQAFDWDSSAQALVGMIHSVHALQQ
ncbi:MAG: glycosyltransferase family 4 protein [Brevibacterium sp.]|uniref:glycosyltransferase family 4 protein n=1 Tax=Brevibacterium sp. TaxID=1701 RepID=UPI002648A9AD|nr:glycosyltransferase family 1 protein [Brevibacterium sp.]MDN5807160.1 glycosyltransferase family 4 protein [Brevibacterium sp.]MDN5833573.1 glycosyltransferase family 4 protein [Brevibacterium sp.]MDN5876859.1 glycosyltransferase family 4 protein [Brevibacterium sp.]MDN5909030.1 glycosyltransferase family 4 protein [Brevibacterium sp.]MDN6175376.1 glycosyltransferase family 4 protein [Brevibacterium sp.]